MTQENILKQIQKIKEDLTAYKTMSNAMDSSVGNSTAIGFSSIVNSLVDSIITYLQGIPDGLVGKGGQEKRSLYYYLTLLRSIDVCSVLNTINNLSSVVGAKFDPNNPPSINDPKWKIQKAAYDIQTSIDLFNASALYLSDPATAITNLLYEINPNLTRLGSSNYLGSQEIRDSYPQVDGFNTFIIDVSQTFLNTGAISNSDKKKISSLLNSLSALRQTCILIQALNSPASAIKYAESLIDPKLLKALNDTGLPTISSKDVMNYVSSINIAIQGVDQTMSRVTDFISNFQKIIRACLILVKVFKTLISFFESFPLPNIYTTSGMVIKMTRTTDKLGKYCDDTIKLLNDVNLLLSIIVAMLKGVNSAVESILTELEALIVALGACDRSTDPAIKEVLNNTTNGVQGIRASNKKINEFIQNYEAKRQNSNNTYYGYTIQILTEDVSDQNVLKVTIPRRYGIGLNSANIEVVKTGYTFASDDNVIRDEVKLLLNSKGLVNRPTNGLNGFETGVVNQSMSALQDNDISMDDIPIGDPSEDMDSATNEDENVGLGLNAFVNKLKGGKGLRKRVKSMINQSKQKLNSDLANVKK